MILISLTASLVCAQSYTISTAVGAGPPSNVAGKSTSLAFGFPYYLAADSAGDVFFIDRNSVIEMNASNNVLTIVAGNGTTGYSGDNGPATSAELNNPQGLAVDSNGTLYIADAGNNAIRKVSGGTITTIAGNGNTGAGCANGPAASVSFNNPGGLAVDSHGGLFIADTGDYCISELSNGNVTTVAGTGESTALDGSNLGDNGPATAATFGFAASIALDSAGNLYIADAGNDRIREVNAITQKIATVAGNGAFNFAGDGGAATAASLMDPVSVAIDSNGNVFISDSGNQAVREVSGGNIDTVAGNNGLGAGFSGDPGAATQAQLSAPGTIALAGSGNLYIADSGNNRIREVSGTIIDTIVGNGSIGDGGLASAAQLISPTSLALDTSGNLYIADSQAQLVRQVNATTGAIATIAGNGTAGGTIVNGNPATSVGIGSPAAVAADKNGNVYVADTFGFTVLEVTGGLISAPVAAAPSPL